MNVKELIAKLQTMPPDAEVIYRCCSDWAILNADSVELKTAEESKAEHVTSRFGYGGIVYRGGRFCDGYPKSQYGDEKPVYRTVVTFPGN
jgi:hypothetical protein